MLLLDILALDANTTGELTILAVGYNALNDKHNW